MNVVQRALTALILRVAPGLSPVRDGRGGWYPWRIHEPYTGAWQRNDELTVDSVLAHHAVYSCITRIAQDVGKLRPKLVEQDADGIWTETDSAAYSPVLRRPNHFQNRIQFIEWWVTSKLTHGNTYVLLGRDGSQIVRRMYVLDPARVTVLVSPDGAVFYQLKIDNLSGIDGEEVAVPASEIIHDRMNCLFHPLVGVSPIFACGHAAMLGLNIERSSSALFANGSNPGGILSSPIPIPPAKSKELSDIWNSAFTGDNTGKVAVLGDGMKFEAMRMTAVDAQLIEQLKMTAEMICSTFHVPAFKAGVGAQPTYANAEIANQVYYSDCLQSHIEAFELCMDDGLGLSVGVHGRGAMGIELDLDGLLRMDQASQVETLTKGIRGGLMTPNGARKKIDERPLEGGDTIYLQHQDYPMEMIYKRKDLDPPEPASVAPPPVTVPTEEPESDDAARAALARRVARRARTYRMRNAA